jgi:hypothetical protein
VESIDVSAIQEPDHARKAYSRCIVVFTHKGETYKFWLEADTQKKLALKTYPGDDWTLRPKRYEGSKKWRKK